MDIFLPHWKEDPETWRFVESCDAHKEIDKLYVSNEDWVAIFPRGFAKTTRILANILRDLLYGRRENIGYLSWSDLGTESIGRLRIELETNELIKAVFGTLAPEDFASKKMKKLKKWKQQYLQLVNWNSIETLSPWQRIRWRRKRRWIIDDPDEDGDSKDKRKKFRQFVKTTIYNTMMPWGSIKVIGTVVWNDCYVLYLKNKEKRKTVMRYAIEKWKSIWPQMRPMEALEERRKKLWSLVFDQEFMHKPLSSEDQLVKLERCKRWEKLPKQRDRTVLSVDPAKKEKEKSDYTGIVYMGISWGKYYVIWSKQIKLSPLKNEEFIWTLYEKLKPDYVLKEDNIELWMTERLSERWCNIVWVTVTNDKWSRLLEASPHIEWWNVFFRPEKDEDLIEQITQYPDVQHDDLMDAFTMAIIRGMKVTSADVYVVKR